jgi:hypothetical protein
MSHFVTDIRLYHPLTGAEPARSTMDALRVCARDMLRARSRRENRSTAARTE